eukprot:Pompholyxophrys_punicea_v1_NODE_100_length_3480_cov_10.916204.p3 type:complete len:135 gc:universal NODE_100_length_3480_cov_10.916204:2513-2109(-)
MLSDQSISSLSSTMENLTLTNEALSSLCNSIPTIPPSSTPSNSTATQIVYREHVYRKKSKTTGEIVEYRYEYPHIASNRKRGPGPRKATMTGLTQQIRQADLTDDELLLVCQYVDIIILSRSSLRDGSVADAPS